MKKITSAILKTVAYADIFEFPLTEKEIWRYLIGIKTNLFQFQKNLKTLISDRKIGYFKGYYFLKPGKKNIYLRKTRLKFSQEKFTYAKKAAGILRLIPSVWLVGISGALAMNNSPKQDDIDLFIITSPDLLWLTRFLATVIFDILGWRRKPDVLFWENKICLNMFLDAGKLSLPKSTRNLYTAHEIVQLKILVNKHEIYENFLLKNLWVNKYLPQSIIFPKDVEFYRFHQTNKFLLTLEIFLKKWQLFYMKKRRTTEIILPNLIQFHPQDVNFWVKLAYKKRLTDLHLNCDP